MWRFLYFSFSEGFASLWRSRLLNLLSIGTIMFAMFVLGAFIFLGMNLRKITIDWQEQIQFNVFLKDGIHEEDLGKIRTLLEESFFVDEALFISKEEAKRRFAKDFAGYNQVVASLDENPFPASFQVSLLRGIGKDSFTKLAEDLNRLPGIEDLYYDEEIFQRLDFFARLIGLAGWFFGGIMVFVSVFSISNVLKLTFFVRREEVDIMKLVGASRAYIRGPFIVEGLLQGLLGSLMGLMLVYLGYWILDSYLTSNSNFFLGNLDLVFIPTSWLASLVVVGGISGLLGSVFSLNQFLEEHISYQ
jgi:cell division transport system permease protein